ncbi:hypothetical protein V491_00561 [Pseudogymnoascus sp. VKM F-3775]|nr:hypothetical protein V491_00561 [Pseudogymnoascus sp. VKM F-3775]
MKLITVTLFFFTFYIRLSHACVAFYANVTNARDFAGMGSIMDEGVRVCTWNGKLEFYTLAYSHNGRDIRIPLQFDRTNTEVELLYGEEASCSCHGPSCSKPKQLVDTDVPETTV